MSLEGVVEVDLNTGLTAVIAEIPGPELGISGLVADNTNRRILLTHWGKQIVYAIGMDDGSVQVTLEDFDVRCQQFTRRDVAKTLSDFRSQLEQFVRIGVVELGPDENRPETRYAVVVKDGGTRCSRGHLFVGRYPERAEQP